MKIKRVKCLNAWYLKLLMAALMVLDHMNIIHNLFSPEVTTVFTIISRCVAPVFAYLAVEGLIHTRSIKNYCLRLFALSGVVFAGNSILNQVFKSFSGMVSEAEQKYLFINNNVIITLALGALVIALIKMCQESKKKAELYLLAAVFFVVGFLWCEWGSVLLPFMVVVYVFREKTVYRFIGYAVIEIIAILLPFGEPLYFIAFPFIFLYNGERGANTRFSKYFFYVFYPLHLWIIAVINFVMMTRIGSR